MCAGAFVFDQAGKVLASAARGADGVFRLGGVEIAMTPGEHPVAFAAAPGGHLAALLNISDGLTLFWAPPPRGGRGKGG
jgi:hypothetical protein